MKRKSLLKEEDPKKSISAATNFSTSNAVAPPAFNLKSNSQQGLNQESASSTQISKAPPSHQQQNSNLAIETEPTVNTDNEATNENENANEESNLVTLSSIDLFNAVEYSHSIFKATAKFRNITIMGQTAIGAPGCLDGQDLHNNIKYSPQLSGSQGNNQRMTKAVARVVGDRFQMWKNSLLVPGMPWYPAFNFFPAPMAPPMPNIPTPLMALPAAQKSRLTNASSIAQDIMQDLPSELQNGSNAALVQGLAIQVANYFNIWFLTAYVTDVIGYGPVPGFQPPFSPGGPVLKGSVLPIPSPF